MAGQLIPVVLDLDGGSSSEQPAGVQNQGTQRAALYERAALHVLTDVIERGSAVSEIKRSKHVPSNHRLVGAAIPTPSCRCLANASL